MREIQRRSNRMSSLRTAKQEATACRHCERQRSRKQSAARHCEPVRVKQPKRSGVRR
ncbi:MAG: hypothetical protein LBH30_03405 [Prevotellaceae bacterium]|nr:hypothetical protein [Prevotellaceae bacterium]